ncbi:hypothetical protein L1987_77919 [Smallanthus sonchifolius]|uniref:Uncharacterized protein n=1 Tax=Smallanthus sonchifolius TaxID=185202 RepID=A0ACB8ZCA7_9ASTR|nr:hypothetical protein L1987_77919 [Smallanthus sonchifolius]
MVTTASRSLCLTQKEISKRMLDFVKSRFVECSRRCSRRCRILPKWEKQKSPDPLNAPMDALVAVGYYRSGKSKKSRSVDFAMSLILVFSWCVRVLVAPSSVPDSAMYIFKFSVVLFVVGDFHTVIDVSDGFKFSVVVIFVVGDFHTAIDVSDGWFSHRSPMDGFITGLRWMVLSAVLQRMVLSA